VGHWNRHAAAAIDSSNKSIHKLVLCISFYFCISHIIQLTPPELSAEPKNSASAEALAVARRPKRAIEGEDPANSIYFVCSYATRTATPPPSTPAAKT